MTASEDVRHGLTQAMSGAPAGRAAADRLCEACVSLLGVDGAALSVVHDGGISRSLGSSGPLSGELDELQFTLGEGPWLQAVNARKPVLVPDLSEPGGDRWPGFSDAALRRGIRAVFALPVAAIPVPLGALDLYRRHPGELDGGQLAGGLIAAELAALPLLDMLRIDFRAGVNDETSSAWDQLNALTRVELYQAAGMVMVQLGVSPAEALVRIRAYAFSHDLTASEVGFAIVDHGLRLEGDERDEPDATCSGQGRS